MDFKRVFLIVSIMLDAWLWPLVQGSQSYNRDSLDSFLYDYALQKIPRPRADKVYDVSLPSNFSGMEVSIARVRTRSLWENGASYRSFDIPPRILPWPFTRRFDIIFQNLGILSSNYYSVPNYTLVAPVIGLLAYDYNRRWINDGLIELKTMGEDPFIVKFPSVDSKEHGKETMKCVRFDTNGTLEFSNLTGKSSCVVSKQGHFSVVIPYQLKKAKAQRWTKWWIVGVSAGVGVFMVCLLSYLVYKWIRKRKRNAMEREAERSEGLDTTWIGRSRMPSALAIRTQPVIESDYVP